jgi:hypothetical protein
MEDYKYKYLKYKNKYLSLKQTMPTQIGGQVIIENPLSDYTRKLNDPALRSLNPEITITESVLMILEQTKLLDRDINRENKREELNKNLKYLLTVSKTDNMDGYTTINMNILYDINTLDQDITLTIEMGLIMIMLQIYTNYFPKNTRDKPSFIDNILRLLRISKTYKDGQEHDLNMKFIIHLLNVFTINKSNPTAQEILKAKEQKLKFIKFLLNPYYAKFETGKKPRLEFSKYNLWDLLTMRELYNYNTLNVLELNKHESKLSEIEKEKDTLLQHAIAYSRQNILDNQLRNNLFGSKTSDA